MAPAPLGRDLSANAAAAAASSANICSSSAPGSGRRRQSGSSGRGQRALCATSEQGKARQGARLPACVCARARGPAPSGGPLQRVAQPAAHWLAPGRAGGQRRRCRPQCSAVQCRAVQSSPVQSSSVQARPVRCNPKQCSPLGREEQRGRVYGRAARSRSCALVERRVAVAGHFLAASSQRWHGAELWPRHLLAGSCAICLARLGIELRPQWLAALEQEARATSLRAAPLFRRAARAAARPAGGLAGGRAAGWLATGERAGELLNGRVPAAARTKAKDGGAGRAQGRPADGRIPAGRANWPPQWRRSTIGGGPDGQVASASASKVRVRARASRRPKLETYPLGELASKRRAGRPLARWNPINHWALQEEIVAPSRGWLVALAQPRAPWHSIAPADTDRTAPAASGCRRALVFRVAIRAQAGRRAVRQASIWPESQLSSACLGSVQT